MHKFFRAIKNVVPGAVIDECGRVFKPKRESTVTSRFTSDMQSKVGGAVVPCSLREESFGMLQSDRVAVPEFLLHFSASSWKVGKFRVKLSVVGVMGALLKTRAVRKRECPIRKERCEASSKLSYCK